jgi:hypothetical protein
MPYKLIPADFHVFIKELLNLSVAFLKIAQLVALCQLEI